MQIYADWIAWLLATHSELPGFERLWTRFNSRRLHRDEKLSWQTHTGAVTGHSERTGRIRLERERKEYLDVAKQLSARSARWTIIGVGAEIMGIGLAIGQAAGGPRGFIGLATAIAAGALAWVVIRSGGEKRARIQLSIRLLDRGLIRLSEVHTENSWAVMVDELEDALEVPYTASSPVYSLPALDS
jgi:hypothetical protein